MSETAQQAQAPQVINPAEMEKQPIENQARAEELVAATVRAEIDSPEKMGKGVELDSMIQQRIKLLEAERTSFVQPLNNVVTRINARFKPITTALKEARGTIQTKMKQFRAEQERVAREEAERQRKEMEEQALAEAQTLADAGSTEAAEQVLEEAAEAPAPLVSVPTGPVYGGLAGTASFTKVGKWKPVDESLVPREYLCLDEKKINAATKPTVEKGGVREIPGLEIWEEEEMTNR